MMTKKKDEEIRLHTALIAYNRNVRAVTRTKIAFTFIFVRYIHKYKCKTTTTHMQDAIKVVVCMCYSFRPHKAQRTKRMNKKKARTHKIHFTLIAFKTIWEHHYAPQIPFAFSLLLARVFFYRRFFSGLIWNACCWSAHINVSMLTQQKYTQLFRRNCLLL